MISPGKHGRRLLTTLSDKRYDREHRDRRHDKHGHRHDYDGLAEDGRDTEAGEEERPRQIEYR